MTPTPPERVAPPAEQLRIVVDFAKGADLAAVEMLAQELEGWTMGRGFTYGADKPRVESAPPAELEARLDEIEHPTCDGCGNRLMVEPWEINGLKTHPNNLCADQAEFNRRPGTGYLPTPLAPRCKRNLVCVLDDGHEGLCQRAGGVEVPTVAPPAEQGERHVWICRDCGAVGGNGVTPLRHTEACRDGFYVETIRLPLSNPADDPELVEALRDFLDWFDSRFPRDGQNLPGVTLYGIAERARGALSSDHGIEP